MSSEIPPRAETRQVADPGRASPAPRGNLREKRRGAERSYGARRGPADSKLDRLALERRRRSRSGLKLSLEYKFQSDYPEQGYPMVWPSGSLNFVES